MIPAKTPPANPYPRSVETKLHLLPTHKQLVALRLRSGLSQVQLSERSGISQTRIGQWEAGLRDPGAMRVKDAVRLCIALKIKVETLFG